MTVCTGAGSSGAPRVAAIIPAAGSSARMQLVEVGSKLLLPFGESTIIERTLERLLISKYISQAVLLVPEEQLEAFTKLTSGLGQRCAVNVCPGGDSRKGSVWRGLQALRAVLRDQDYVLIHDGARCLLTPALVDRCIEAAFEHQAVTAAIQCVDSLIRVDSDGHTQSIDRKGVWLVQTPQVFRYGLLLEAHRRQAGDASDDASLVEPFCPVHLVEGERTNIKITTPEDLLVARALA